MAVRPKTLGAAAAPVIIAVSLAWSSGASDWGVSLTALFCALMLQVGANFANDYFDFIKGADTVERTGPVRVTSAGLVTPQEMKLAMVMVFALAVIPGIYLIYRGGIPIMIIGAASILSAILYTGGPYPLGYHGLGDLFVLIFFGFAAVCGTYYIHAGEITFESLAAGLATGLFSTAILTVNNLRDMETDGKTGKRTLAVRFGKNFARLEYLACIAIPCIIPMVMYVKTGLHPFSMASALVFIPAVPLIQKIFYENPGPGFNKVLGDTGRLLLIYSLLFALGRVLPG